MRSDVFGYVRVRSDEKKIDEFVRSKIGPAGKGWRRAGGWGREKRYMAQGFRFERGGVGEGKH